MGTLLSIDPGKNAGLAWFVDAVLTRCGLTGPEPIEARGDDHCVSEFPRIYPGQRSKGDGNSLLSVARDAGRLTSAFEENQITWVAPRTWKGTVPKAVMAKRILAALSPEERVLVPHLPKTTLHNVIDAIGIGLWHLGRLKP